MHFNKVAEVYSSAKDFFHCVFILFVIYILVKISVVYYEILINTLTFDIIFIILINKYANNTGCRSWEVVDLSY